jgi:telomerase reverse transcriptase
LHLLCHGFQRATDHCPPNLDHAPTAGIRGIVPKYPNKNVSMLKTSPWTEVLNLLGKDCEEIMLHLLLDCGLFMVVDNTKETLYQLSGEWRPDSFFRTALLMVTEWYVSGIQLSELKVPDQTVPNSICRGIRNDSTANLAVENPRRGNDIVQTPGNIIFVRRRMLYARAGLNAKGEVRLGLKHIRMFQEHIPKLLQH